MTKVGKIVLNVAVVLALGLAVVGVQRYTKAAAQDSDPVLTKQETAAAEVLQLDVPREAQYAVLKSDGNGGLYCGFISFTGGFRQMGPNTLRVHIYEGRVPLPAGEDAVSLVGVNMREGWLPAFTAPLGKPADVPSRLSVEALQQQVMGLIETEKKMPFNAPERNPVKFDKLVVRQQLEACIANVAEVKSASYQPDL